MQAASIGETLTTWGGQFTTIIPPGASTTTIKAGKGRICKIVITSAGSAAFTIFDSLTASGLVLFVQPGTTTTVGTIYDIQLPAQVGITIQNVSTGPGFIVSFD